MIMIIAIPHIVSFFSPLCSRHMDSRGDECQALTITDTKVLQCLGAEKYKFTVKDPGLPEFWEMNICFKM